MAKLATVSEVITNFEHSRVKSWLDRLKFSHILLLWLFLIAVFAVIYNVGATSTSHLWSTFDKKVITEFYDAFYFSFVAATTTGFGDIVPIGGFRLIAIVEVISGLLLLAVVTSKLVSIKQNVIMNELFEISLHEKIDRLRSSLFLFQQHLNRLIASAEEGTFKKRDMTNLTMYLNSYEQVLIESISYINNQDKKSRQFVKIDLDLLTRNIVSSAAKLVEAIHVFNKYTSSKLTNAQNTIDVIIRLNKDLLHMLKDNNSISKETKRLLKKQFKVSIAHLETIE